MEAIEYFIINGQTCIRRNGVSKALTPKDRDAIEFMLRNMEKCFLATVKRLKEWAADSAANKRFFEYRVVDRFIRCNFGEADFLYPDVENGMFHFEEVKCPLRGICRDENIICKPKIQLPVGREEGRAVMLYSKGLSAYEIAAVVGKSVKTIKNQLDNVRKRLRLDRTRDLIKIFSIYTLWE